MSATLYRSVGGKKVDGRNRAFSTFVASEGAYWNFGWVAPHERTDAQQEAHEQHVAQMQPFQVVGAGNRAEEEKTNLTSLWSHPMVTQALGYAYPGIHQLTGSCVGAGGGNVAATMNYVETCKNGEPDKVIRPFFPYTYGCSRKRMGEDGPGEGSLGSAWAEAAKQDGVIDDLSHSELPKPQNSDGLVWGERVEMSWSAGGRAPCTEWIEQGRKHLVRTVSELKNAQQVWEAISNGYPVTEASMYGFDAKIEDGVLIGRRGPRWGHQMSFHAVWKHPKFGRLFWCQNQWGLNAHGRCPTGMPGGGVWILEKDVEWICQSDGEVYAFSQYDGYPGLDWEIPWIL